LKRPLADTSDLLPTALGAQGPQSPLGRLAAIFRVSADLGKPGPVRETLDGARQYFGILAEQPRHIIAFGNLDALPDGVSSASSAYVAEARQTGHSSDSRERKRHIGSIRTLKINPAGAEGGITKEPSFNVWS
jgi:hypothetical protein